CQSTQLGRATIEPSDPASALLGRSIWPLRGTKQRPQPKDCGLQPFLGDGGGAADDQIWFEYHGLGVSFAG
ncbi:MAG: hypothetical protein QOH78_381, partial [Verrucomicrobiota bacterium]